jgi:hypothetical protein
MALREQNWGTIHPSVFSHALEPVRRIPATLRPQGAIRYRCPVTGSYVLVTEAATLAGLSERDSRLRCVDCSEMHLLALAAPVCDSATIVGEPTKP